MAPVEFCSRVSKNNPAISKQDQRGLDPAEADAVQGRGQAR